MQGSMRMMYTCDVDVATPVAASVLLFYCSTVGIFGGLRIVSVVPDHVCGGEQAEHDEPGGLHAPHHQRKGGALRVADAV